MRRDGVGPELHGLEEQRGNERCDDEHERRIQEGGGMGNRPDGQQNRIAN